MAPLVWLSLWDVVLQATASLVDSWSLVGPSVLRSFLKCICCRRSTIFKRYTGVTLFLVDGLQQIHFKKNLRTLRAMPCRRWRWPEGEPGVPPPSSETWKDLLLLLLWVVGEPSGPHWRAGLGVAVPDCGPGRGVEVLASTAGE